MYEAVLTFSHRATDLVRMGTILKNINPVVADELLQLGLIKEFKEAKATNEDIADNSTSVKPRKHGRSKATRKR